MDITLTIADDHAKILEASFPDVQAYLQARVTQFVETFVLQTQATSADAVTAAFLAAPSGQREAILSAAGLLAQPSRRQPVDPQPTRGL